MWIARDKSGTLTIFNSKPIKRINVGMWDDYSESFILIKEPYPDLFPSVQWEDEEPTEFKLVKK